jgi:hypothetical protein
MKFKKLQDMCGRRVTVTDSNSRVGGYRDLKKILDFYVYRTSIIKLAT